ncbi:E3 ubiquitin-protein ligase HUWE1 [Theileria orientalis]|uniref:HECT-type E3 ubiquitin transferase n=1 Tax=Theileria orientalis TaxID=68886 RepID=A0A976M9A0_THEOR|nr:E3 ubiquitin-protein ligase HUWE1 [Theileria orientalis]
MKIGYPKGDNYKLVLASLQPCQRRFIECLSTCTENDLLSHLGSFTQWVWEKSDIICWASVLNRFDDIFTHYLEISRSYLKGELDLDHTSYSKQVELVKVALKTSIMIVENSTSKSLYNSLDHLKNFLDDVNLEIVYFSTRLLCVYFSSRNRRNLVMNEIPAVSSRLATFVTNPLPERDYDILSSNSTEYTRLYDKGTENEFFVSCPLVLEHYLKCYQYWLSKDSYIKLDLYNRQDVSDHLIQIPLYDFINVERISQLETETSVQYNSNEKFNDTVNNFVFSTNPNQMYFHILKTYKYLVDKYKIDESQHHLICMLLINTSTYTQFLNYNPSFLLELSWFIKCYEYIDYSTMIISTELLSAMIYDGIQYKTLSNLLGFGVPHGIFVKVLKSYLHHPYESQPLPPVLKLPTGGNRGTSQPQDMCTTVDYTKKDEKELCMMNSTGFVVENFREEFNWFALVTDPVSRVQIVRDEERMRVLLHLLIVYYSIISYHGNCGALTSVNVLEALVRFTRCRNPVFTPVIIYVVQVLEALLDYNQSVSRVLRTDLQLFHMLISRLKFDMYKIEHFAHFGNHSANKLNWPQGWLLPTSNDALVLRVYWLTVSEWSARMFLFKTLVKDIYSVTRPYSGRTEINDYDVFAPTSPMVPVILRILKDPLKYGHGVYSSVVTLILDTLGDDPVSQEEMHKLGIVPAFLSSINEETLRSEEALGVVPTAVCDLFIHRTGQEYYKSMKYTFVLKLMEIVVKKEFVLFDRFGEVAASIGISLDTIVRHHDSAHLLVVKRVIRVIYDLLLESLTFPEFKPVPTDVASAEKGEYLEQYKTNSKPITLETLSLLDHLSPGDFFADRIANLGKCLSTFLSYPQSVSYFNSCDGIKLLMQLCTVPCLPPMFLQIYSQHPLVLIIKYLTSQSPIPSVVHFHAITQEYLASFLRNSPGKRPRQTNSYVHSLNNYHYCTQSTPSSGRRGGSRSSSFSSQSSHTGDTNGHLDERHMIRDCDFKRFHGTLQFLHLMHKDNASVYQNGCCGKHQLGVNFVEMSTCDLHVTATLALDVLSSELANMFYNLSSSFAISNRFCPVSNVHLSHEHPQLRAYKEFTADKKNAQSDVVFSSNDLFWSTQCLYAYSSTDGGSPEAAGAGNCGLGDRDLMVVEMYRSTLQAAKSLMFSLNMSINKAVCLGTNGNDCLRTHLIKNASQIVTLTYSLLATVDSLTRAHETATGTGTEADVHVKYFMKVKYMSDVLEVIYRLIIDERTNGLYLFTMCLFVSAEGMRLVSNSFDYFFTLFFAVVSTMGVKMNPALTLKEILGTNLDPGTSQSIETFVKDLLKCELPVLKSLYTSLVNSLQICLSFFSKCTNPRTVLNTQIDAALMSLLTFELTVRPSSMRSRTGYNFGASRYIPQEERRDVGNMFNKMVASFVSTCWRWFGFLANLEPVAPASSTASPFFYIPTKLMTLLIKVHIYVLDYLSPSRQQALNLHFLNFGATNAPGEPAEPAGAPAAAAAAAAQPNARRGRRRTRTTNSSDSDGDSREADGTNLETVRSYLSEMGFNERDINNAISHCGTSDITTLTDWLINIGDFTLDNLDLTDYSQVSEDDNVNQMALEHLKRSHLFHLCNIEPPEPMEPTTTDYECADYRLPRDVLFHINMDAIMDYDMTYPVDLVDYKQVIENLSLEFKAHLIEYMLNLSSSMPTFLPTAYDTIFKLHSFKFKFTLPSDMRSRRGTVPPSALANGLSTGADGLKNKYNSEVEFSVQNLLNYILAQISVTFREFQSSRLNVKTENALSLFSPVIFIEETEKQAALDQVLKKALSEWSGSPHSPVVMRPSVSLSMAKSRSMFKLGGLGMAVPIRKESVDSAKSAAKQASEYDVFDLDYNNKLAVHHDRLLALFYLLSHLMAGKENFTHLAYKVRDENNRPINMLQLVLEVVEHFLTLRTQCFSKGVLNMNMLNMKRKFGLPVLLPEWCLSGEWETWFAKRTSATKFDFDRLSYGLHAKGCTPQIAAPPPFFKYALICLHELVKTSILDATLLHPPQTTRAQQQARGEREGETQSKCDRDAAPKLSRDAVKQYREYEISDQAQERLLHACMRTLDLFPGLDGEVSFSLLSILTSLTEGYKNADKLARYKSLTTKSNMDFLRLLLALPRSAQCPQALRMVSAILLRVMEDNTILRPSIKNKILSLLSQGPMNFNSFIERLHPFNRKCPMLLLQMVESMCVITVDEALYPNSDEGTAETKNQPNTPDRPAGSNSPRTAANGNEPRNYELKDLSVALKNDKVVRDLISVEGLDFEMVGTKEFKIDQKRAFQMVRMISEFVHISCNLHGLTDVSKNTPRTFYPLAFTSSNYFFLLSAMNYNFPLPLQYPEHVTNAAAVSGELHLKTFPYKLDKLDKCNMKSLILFITRTVFSMICCLVYPKNMEPTALGSSGKNGSGASKSDTEESSDVEQMQKMIIDSLEGYSTTLMVLSSHSEEASACVVEEVAEMLHHISGMNYRDSGPYLVPMAVYTLCNLLHNLLQLRFSKIVNLSDVLVHLKKNLCLILSRLDLFKSETRVVCGSITRVLVLLTNTTNVTYEQARPDEGEEAAVVVELEDSVTDDSDQMESDEEDSEDVSEDEDEEDDDIELDFSEVGEYTEEGEYSEDGEQEGEDEMIIDVSSSESNETTETDNPMDDASEDETNVDMVLPHEVEEDYQSNEYSPTVSSSSMEDVEEEEEDEGPRIRVAGEIDEMSRTENSQIIDTTTNISIPEENESDYLASLSEHDEPAEETTEEIVPVDEDSTYATQRSLPRSNNGNHTIHIEIQFANNQNARYNIGHPNNVRVPTTVSSISYPPAAANAQRFYTMGSANSNRQSSNGTSRNTGGFRTQDSVQTTDNRQQNDAWSNSGDFDMFSKNPLLPQFKRPYTVELPDPLMHVLLKRMKVFKVKYQDSEPEDQEIKVEKAQSEPEVAAQPPQTTVNGVQSSQPTANGVQTTTIANGVPAGLQQAQTTETSGPTAQDNGNNLQADLPQVESTEVNLSAGQPVNHPTVTELTVSEPSGAMDVDSQGRYYNRGLELIANALGITYMELFSLANMDPGVIAELPTDMREEIISQQLNTISVDTVSSLRESRPRPTNNLEGPVPSRSELQYLEALPRALRLDVTRAIYGENSTEANEINASIDLQGDNTSLIAALGPFFRGEAFNSVNEFLTNITTSLEALERPANATQGTNSQPQVLENLRSRFQSHFNSLQLTSNPARIPPGSNPANAVNPVNPVNPSRPLILPIINNVSRSDSARNDLERAFPRSQIIRADATEPRTDPGNGLTLGFIIGEIRGQNGINRRINGRHRMNRRMSNNLGRRNDMMRDVFLLSGRNLRMSRLNESLNQISLAGTMNDLSLLSPENMEMDDRSSNFDPRILQSIPQILNTFDPGLMDLFPNRSIQQEPQDAPEVTSDNVMDEIVQSLPTSPCSPSLFRRGPGSGAQKEKEGSDKEITQSKDNHVGMPPDSQVNDTADSSYSLLSKGCGGEMDSSGLVGVCKMFFLPNEINKRVFFKLLYNISLGPSQNDLIKMLLYMLKESILNVDVEYECTDVDETFFKKCPKIVNARSANAFSHLFTLRSSHTPFNKPKQAMDQGEKLQTLSNSIRQVFDTSTKLEYENFSYMCSERVLEQLRSLFIALPLTVTSFSKSMCYVDEPASHELKRKKKRTEACSSFHPIDFFFSATATNLFQSSTRHMNHLLMVIHNLLVHNSESQKLDGYGLEPYTPESYNPANYKPESSMSGLDKEIVGDLARTTKVDSNVHCDIINSLSPNALAQFLQIFTSYRCQSAWLQFCNAKDANSNAQMDVISQFMAAVYRQTHRTLIVGFMSAKFKEVAKLLSECLLGITANWDDKEDLYLDYQMEPLMFSLVRMTQLMLETIKQVYAESDASESDQQESAGGKHLEELHVFFKEIKLDDLWERLDDCLVYLTEVSLAKNIVGDFYKELHIEDAQNFDQVRSLIPLIEVFLNISQTMMAYEYNVPDLQFDKILSHINYEAAGAQGDKPDLTGLGEKQDAQPGESQALAEGPSSKLSLSVESNKSLRDDEDELVIDMSPSHANCLNFVERHKKLLNLFIKQSPSMLNNAFLPLIRVAPMCLSFDVKRQYFRQKLREGRMGLRIDPIKINVRRQHVFLDSYHQLRLKTSDEMKGKLTVSFGGEEGVDAGGLTREWYTILSKEIFNPNYALFTREGRKQEFNHPNPLSAINPDHLNYFKFIGRIIGKALYDGHHMEAYFCRSFYKHMLGTRITPCDAESVDPQFYNNLISIRNSTLEQLGLELYFSTEIDEFGKVKVIDLVPNGRNILVTDENKHRYIQLLCKHKVTNGIRDQLDAFMEGFRELISPELISIFDDRELELLISGIPIIDLRNMRQNVEYVNYSESSDQIRWLWEILGEFDQSHLAAFLQFVTGTSRVPIGGFKNLMGMRGPQKISIHKTFGEDRLPTAHTCFNQLDLPVYRSKDMLKSKLLQAILEGKEGFGFI